MRSSDVEMGWLREAREAQEPPLTQRALARVAGVSQAMVSQVESGARRPTREFVERVAQVLGVGRDEALVKCGFTPRWLREALMERPEKLEWLKKEMRR